MADRPQEGAIPGEPGAPADRPHGPVGGGMPGPDIRIPDKPRGPTLVLDPYNRLTSGDQSHVPGGAGYGGPSQLPGQASQFQPKPRVTHGAAWKPSTLAPHAAALQDFMLQVRCLNPQQLDALFNQMMAERKALEKLGRTAARNTEIQKLNRYMGYINGQKNSPQPCTLAEDISSVGVTHPTTPLRPEYQTPFGPAMADRTRTEYAEEVELMAPVADLYGKYAMQALEREATQMEEEIARMESGYVDYTVEMIPQPGISLPSLPTQVIYPTVSDSDASMPTMPSTSLDPIEDELTTNVGVPSVAMATAEPEQKKIPWWVLAIGGFILFGS
jgi:hypothetical protein